MLWRALTFVRPCYAPSLCASVWTVVGCGALDFKPYVHRSAYFSPVPTSMEVYEGNFKPFFQGSRLLHPMESASSGRKPSAGVQARRKKVPTSLSKDFTHEDELYARTLTYVVRKPARCTPCRSEGVSTHTLTELKLLSPLFICMLTA
jgi:hypothetical protein